MRPSFPRRVSPCVPLLTLLLASCAGPSTNTNTGTSVGPRIVASSYYDRSDSYKPENVLDGDDKTAWAAQGSEPAKLTITPDHAGVLESIRLVARQTGLFETWQKVDVKLYSKDRMVLEQSFTFPNAATERLQNITIQPVETDKIEFGFSGPVTKTPAGQTVSPPAAVNPGYAEIVLNWKR